MFGLGGLPSQVVARFLSWRYARMAWISPQRKIAHVQRMAASRALSGRWFHGRFFIVAQYT